MERSFAHLCDTGGGRRSWLCGLEKINKRYAIHAAAYNLAVLMRKVFGLGKPLGLAAACAAILAPRHHSPSDVLITHAPLAFPPILWQDEPSSPDTP